MTASIAARPRAVQARYWIVFTRILALAIFTQAVTAGRILTGDGWARDAHRFAAELLIAGAAIGAAIAAVRLRESAVGKRFASVLGVIAIAIAAQYGLGATSVKGNDTLWIHIPVGVALVAMTVWLEVLARALRRPS